MSYGVLPLFIRLECRISGMISKLLYPAGKHLVNTATSLHLVHYAPLGLRIRTETTIDMGWRSDT